MSLRRAIGAFVLVGLLVCVVLAFVVAPFASSEPDGLERVAADQGLDANEQEHALADGPLADYGVKGVDDDRLATGVAGIVGVLVTFAVVVGALWVVSRSRRGSRRNELPIPSQTGP